MKELRGIHAVVTGSSRGLGTYIARALAKEGSNLTLTARNEEALREVAEELSGYPVRVNPIAADLNEEEERRKLLRGAVATLGPVDLLVNNAALEWISRYAKLPADAIETMIRTNLVAPLMLSRLVLPEMIDRGRGHIVMVSSLGGKKGSPYSATYAATKAALITWTSAMRAELQGTGVGVSVVSPGFVTEAGMFAMRNERAPWILGTSPPEAVARAVVRAVHKDVGDIIVNRGPVRLGLLLETLSPDLMSWLLRRLGVFAYYRARAEAEEVGGPDSDGSQGPGSAE